MAGAFGRLGRAGTLLRFAVAFLAVTSIGACGSLAERIKTEPLVKPAEPIASLGIVIVDKPLTEHGLDFYFVPKSSTDQLEIRRAQILRVAPPTLEAVLRFYGLDGHAIVASYPMHGDWLSPLAAYDYVLVLTPVRAKLEHPTFGRDEIWFDFTASLIERSSGTEVWRASRIAHLGYIGGEWKDRAQSTFLSFTFRNVLMRMAGDGYLALTSEALKAVPRPLPDDALPVDGNIGIAADGTVTAPVADGASPRSGAAPPASGAPAAETSLADLPTPPASPLPQTIDFKAPRLGMRVYLDTGGYLQVSSFSGATVHTVNAAQREAEWIGLFFTPSNRAQQFDRATAESIWPLEIGKSVSFKMTGTGASGSPGEWQETITVVRQEQLTTQAGQFRTMVVETREQSLTGPFQAVSTRWYSPDVGFVVKYRRVIEQGTGNESAWTASRIMTPGS